ncbi:hypothetical protein CXG81DRAFT_27155 [Caulochytrium protostelioides]|uniref:Uncharacterized protein n=1 Tax=Caulochytrium protostelioides TaxID=1555241 RepID=A0A4P9X4Y8_9FUNG|nr:hypothetical protein CXG81DRAFT_27155 [Caulochytrium protostelioides]|eukprot:RKP00121.1 hypothetical protein CXG81DRAFT_27155 [Caulochytrium protostelioides]
MRVRAFAAACGRRAAAGRPSVRQPPRGRQGRQDGGREPRDGHAPTAAVALRRVASPPTIGVGPRRTGSLPRGMASSASASASASASWPASPPPPPLVEPPVRAVTAASDDDDDDDDDGALPCALPAPATPALARRPPENETPTRRAAAEMTFLLDALAAALQALPPRHDPRPASAAAAAADALAHARDLVRRLRAAVQRYARRAGAWPGAPLSMAWAGPFLADVLDALAAAAAAAGEPAIPLVPVPVQVPPSPTKDAGRGRGRRRRGVAPEPAPEPAPSEPSEPPALLALARRLAEAALRALPLGGEWPRLALPPASVLRAVWLRGNAAAAAAAAAAAGGPLAAGRPSAPPLDAAGETTTVPVLAQAASLASLAAPRSVSLSQSPSAASLEEPRMAPVFFSDTLLSYSSTESDAGSDARWDDARRAWRDDRSDASRINENH